MISDRALELAVERAIITAEQAGKLRGIEAHVGLSVDPLRGDNPDDEALRFVTGFADIFVTIGILLFVGALAFLVNRASGAATAFGAVAVAAWLLAEFFTRRRRMALPGITLLVVYVIGAFGALLWALSLVLPAGATAYVDNLRLLPTRNGFAMLLAGLGTTLFAAVHYHRFRVPITIAAGMAALFVAVLGLALSILHEGSLQVVNALALVWGIVTFGLAMRFDLSDPARATRRTDIAFWLHLLAAPLIVHTLVRGFLPDLGQPTTTGAILVLGAFVVLGMVAVIIDRRAILVSGLLYAGIAFGTLIKGLGLADASLLIPVVLLGLGTFILLLSAGWQPLRAIILTRLPTAFARRLPHPMVVSKS